MANSDSDFVFVGYLVQEPFVRNWWMREGKRLASLENTVHPSFGFQWQSVKGVLNLTEFLLVPPDMSEFPGWLLFGYSVERDAIPKLRVEMLDHRKEELWGLSDTNTHCNSIVLTTDLNSSDMK
jgi:hypothetical protein